MLKISAILLFIMFIASCENLTNSIKQTTGFGKSNLYYYADKATKSLDIPPDLTSPNQKNALHLDEYIDVNDKLIDFKGNNNIVIPVNKVKKQDIEIEVKRDNNNRWIIINKDANYAWNMAKDFLIANNFSIKKSNKKIGILETNYLENKISIPNKNLGFIRSILKKSLGVSYSLPVLDRYRIRVESIAENKTEIYLSLDSLAEVVTNAGSDDENTIWQAKEKDKNVEIEMLYRLMIYLGGDANASKEKIKKIEKNIVKVSIKKALNGYNKLQFSLNKEDTWNSIDFALNNLQIYIEDKDLNEGSFYVVANYSGFKKLITEQKEIFQIKIKELNESLSEVYFYDLGGKNEKSTIELANQTFASIAEQF